MRPLPVRRRPLASPLGAAALLALAGAACSDGPLDGPGLPRGGASLRLAPRVEARASVVAAGIARVRIGITRVPDGLVVLDSVVDLGGGPTALDLAVPLASASDRFAVRLAAADAAGDTIFRAADTTAVVRGAIARSLELLLRYAGPDTGVTRIVAGPETAVVDAGASVPLWVVGFRPGAADPAPLAHVTWRSGDETVVRVSRTGGQATAVAPGRAAWIYASTVTGLVDSAHVVVRNVLATLEPSPAALSVVVGANATVSVAGHAPDGSALAADGVTWSTSDPAVAIVDADGAVRALGPGDATITATSGGAQATIPVSVRRPAVAGVTVAPAAVSLLRTARAQLSATVALETGAVAADQPVAWTTSDASIATVDADGIVRATGVGAATVTASAAGRAASVPVTVAALPADAIVASPAVVALQVGETMTLGATATDATGNVVPNTPIAWASANPAVASVSAAGTVAAVAPGTTTVTASANGRASTVTVTVVPVPVVAVPVASVRLSAGKTAVVVGDGVSFAATPLAADSTPLAGRAVTWSSSAPSIATVDAGGRVTTLAVGKAYITATSEGASGTVKVDVLPIPVARVQLSASAMSLLVGNAFQLRADAYDSLGRLLPGRSASWSTSDPSVAGVANDGLVTAKKLGIASISATIDGVIAAATVTIAVPAASPAIHFTPAGAEYAYGQTMTAQAVGITQLAGSATLQLASWNGGIASVQQAVAVTGVAPAPFTVTGRALGTVRLQATAGGATMGLSDVTVVPARLRGAGWTGTVVRRDDYVRIRLEAAGADGLATDAVFAEATTFALAFSDDSLEVHRDRSPGAAVGPAPASDRDVRLSDGDAVQATVGARYVSLIVRPKKVGAASMTVTGPSGRYVRLDLRGMTVTP